MSDTSDVTAVVLTQGEATTEESLASLRRQDLPPREVVVVRGVSPFHRAINTGARQVTTPFFVQVDSDMVLDPDCFAELRRNVGKHGGIVVGHLRDPMIGRVVGVKLFRTAPFLEVMMGDTISPDTDLGRALRRAGWATRYAGRLPRGDPEEWRTFGEHRPDYGPEYTYRKYLLEGRRYRYRDNPMGIRWHFGRLESSGHGSAVFARIGLANGIFLESTRDLLGPQGPDAGFDGLARFLEVPGDAGAEDGDRVDPDVSFQESFERYCQRGKALRRGGGSGRFRQILGSLHGAQQRDAVLAATIGLCRGVAVPEGAAGGPPADFVVLSEFLAAAPEGNTGDALRGFAARLGRRLRGGSA